jgi:hypothetical protein
MGIGIVRVGEVYFERWRIEVLLFLGVVRQRKLF